ncbi:MAG: methylmalonyl-CoA mutase small subunit [Bacteroidales bacterium]|nr:methylmalonyl-CoA mutase small subunit [Bacteroidales bacterium]
MSEKSEKLFTEFPEISTEAWEAVIEKDLKGADYNKKLVWKTDENFVVKPYYRAEDLENIPHMNVQVGEFPYVRGNKADNNDWNIVERIDTPEPKLAHDAAVTALAKGANAIIFNASKIKTAQELNTLLQGIDVCKNRIYFEKAENFKALGELVTAYLSGQPANGKQALITLMNDPVMQMLQHNKFPQSAEASLDGCMAMVKQTKEYPHFQPIAVNGHIFGNCGATIVQELGFSLAIANEYLAYATSHGVSVDELCDHLQFSFSISSDYFMEIAKLRAARMLWAVIVEQYKPAKKESAQMHTLSIASSWNKTMFDAHINILRNTTEGMSASIGGADAIALNPFDETYENADEFSRHIARNAQIIMKEESHFDKVADPAAGSYYIENLTKSIAEQAWKIFCETDKEGGIIQKGLKGEIKAAVEASCQKRNMDIATRKSVLLGTNQYPNLTENVSEKVKFQAPVEQFEGLQPYRGAIPFENIRLETEKWAKAHDGKPKVFLFKIGNLNMRQARAGFITNFFGCAGYQIVESAGYATVADGIQDALNAKAAIVAVCSSDEEYPTFAPEIIAAVKKEQPGTQCIIAGNPTESIEQLKAAGADDFIHVRTNILESLRNYNKLILK